MSNILLLDDDVVCCRYVSKVLCDGGHQVTVVHTCADARLACSDTEYSLILLDYELPDGNGIDMISWFQNHPRLSIIPILMFTACSSESTLKSSFELGVNDYLTKPVSRTELLLRTANAIRIFEGNLAEQHILKRCSLQRISALLAHEINNPLAVISYGMEELRPYLIEGQAQRKFELLEAGLLRIATLVEDLQLFVSEGCASSEWFALALPLRLVQRLLVVRTCGNIEYLGQDAQDLLVYGHVATVSQAILVLAEYVLDVFPLEVRCGLRVTCQRGASGDIGLELLPTPRECYENTLTQLPETPLVKAFRRNLLDFGIDVSFFLEESSCYGVKLIFPAADKLKTMLSREELRPQ